MVLKNNIELDPSIFRTYDIRGVVGKTLTPEIVFWLGKAIGSFAIDHRENRISIARDGRTSSPQLARALSEGIQSTGCDVIDLGMVPTPLLYYATHIFETSHSGVMLTGSHNPADYNGLKIVIAKKTLAENDIHSLYQRIVQNQLYEGNGSRDELNIVDRYVQQVCQNIHLTRPLKIVIDAGNGVTGEIAPRLFKALGCDVHELFCEVDGNFPNHHPDPSQINNLKDLMDNVAHTKADVGLAFDGDGDRLGVITNKGEIIWPDRLLMLYAQSLLQEKNKMVETHEHQDKPIHRIIYDVKCSHHLQELIHAHGGEPVMWKTGHSLIKAKMAEINAILAGEMSGHFFFKDRWFGFDDALYAGARLLEILSQQKNDSSNIFSTIPNSVNTPELKVFVADNEKFQLMEELIHQAHFADAKEMMMIDGLRVNFAEGWGLVRPSNTTPYLILRFEALNHTILEKIQLAFREWMLTVKPDLVLPF